MLISYLLMVLSFDENLNKILILYITSLTKNVHLVRQYVVSTKCTSLHKIIYVSIVTTCNILCFTHVYKMSSCSIFRDESFALNKIFKNKMYKQLENEGVGALCSLSQKLYDKLARKAY